jgi:transcriptional regulator with XRE-family HTH domain
LPDDEYLRERYLLLGRELTRLRHTMGLSREELAARGPLKVQMVGHFERGRRINYEDGTLAAAEATWNLPVGAIRQFLDGAISHLERIDDPLRGMSDEEIARLRDMARLMDQLDMPQVLAAAKTIVDGEMVQARLRVALARAERDMRELTGLELPTGLGDAARVITEAAQALLDRAAG